LIYLESYREYSKETNVYLIGKFFFGKITKCFANVVNLPWGNYPNKAITCNFAYILFILKPVSLAKNIFELMVVL